MRLIDADALKKAIIKHLCVKSENNLLQAEKSIYNCIDEQPTIEQPKWNFFGVQKMTEEEREQYGISDYDKDGAAMLTGCPENGQDVIVYNGFEMFIDTFIVDRDGCYFERTECTIGEGWAWMPLSKPQKDGD